MSKEQRNKDAIEASRSIPSLDAARQDFNIFKGLVVNGFTFRGIDQYEGATFEHECGYTVRFGPGVKISILAEGIRGHDCARDFRQAPNKNWP